MAVVNKSATESWVLRDTVAWQPLYFRATEAWRVTDRASLWKGYDENHAAFDIRTVTPVYDIRTQDSED